MLKKNNSSTEVMLEALHFHQYPIPGKIAIVPTKKIDSAQTLALAYSPGVAAPCLEIQKNPLSSYQYTAKGNLVGVISNGSAVLGLGNIGALASKPVMEGKAILFKQFADIDAFDIEINESDPDKLIDIITALEPTFGGINLEDIKAPECFYIEQELKKRLNIPVFHDDQHGTAIICTAAVLNGLTLTGKKLAHTKVVVSGAGAAAIACLQLLALFGLPRSNIIMCDSKGVIYHQREVNMAASKTTYAIADNGLHTLAEVIADADIFIGCSTAGVLNADMVRKMAPHPLILALANPVPEILPTIAKAARSDVIICTGRSDYPNQVNNLLCFPFIFRGALDVGATTINKEMQMACVNALVALTHTPNKAGAILSADYLIPDPFDPRLISTIPVAVAKAAIESGVAQNRIKNWTQYRKKLAIA